MIPDDLPRRSYFHYASDRMLWLICSCPTALTWYQNRMKDVRSHSSKPQKEAPQQGKTTGHGGLIAITVAIIAAVGGVAAATAPGMLTGHSGAASSPPQLGGTPSPSPSILVSRSTHPASTPSRTSPPTPFASSGGNGYRQVAQYATELDSGYGIISIQDPNAPPERQMTGKQYDLFYTGRTLVPLVSNNGTLAPLTDVPLSFQACTSDDQYKFALAPWINGSFCFKDRSDGIVAAVHVTSIPDPSAPSPSPYTVGLDITVWKSP
jgi:hypothetical protein